MEHMKHHKKHHKIEHHKASHHGMKKEHHSGMIDNRHVKENHQQGIERVRQRPGDMERGQHGKMGTTHRHGDTFKRSGGKMTPTRA